MNNSEIQGDNILVIKLKSENLVPFLYVFGEKSSVEEITYLVNSNSDLKGNVRKSLFTNFNYKNR